MPIKKFEPQRFEGNMDRRRNALDIRVRNNRPVTELMDDLQSIFANYLLFKNPNLIETILDDVENMCEPEHRELIDTTLNKKTLEKQEAILRRHNQPLSENAEERKDQVINTILGESVAQSDYVKKKLFTSDPVFRALTEKATPAELQQMAHNPEEALNSLVKQRELFNRAIALKGDDKESLKRALTNSYDMMRATGTGKNWLGFSRRSNSPAYDNMMESLGAVVGDLDKDDKQITPEEKARNMAKALVATKAYLADKKTVRKTETGDIRVTFALNFLSCVMEREDFQQYCNDINRARGVENNPQDKHFVNAEKDFDFSWQPMPDAVKKRDAKEITEHYCKASHERDKATLRKHGIEPNLSEDEPEKDELEAEQEPEKVEQQPEQQPEKSESQSSKDRKAFKAYIKVHNPSLYQQIQKEEQDVLILKFMGDPAERAKFPKARDDFKKKMDTLAAAWKRQEAQKREKAAKQPQGVEQPKEKIPEGRRPSVRRNIIPKEAGIEVGGP